MQHRLLRRALCLSAIAWPAARAVAQAGIDLAVLREQVFATERAFAKTMAERDHRAFTSFLADEAVFFTGPKPLHGKQAVADVWKRFYDKPDAPFSWEPDEVEVLASGTLAHSSGPVRNPAGKVVARFNSVWRQESPGVWHIVFDKGCELCAECAKP
jgi:ketosteroid isomerase-like protein